MKKLHLLFAFLLIVSASSMAQSYNKWLGGGIGFNSTDKGETKSSEFTFRPTIGFVLSPEWSLGGSLAFTSGKVENNVSETTTTSFGIIPFARYKFASAGKFAFFGQAELPYTNTNEENGSVEISYSSFGIQARPGLTYNFTERLGATMLMPNLLYFRSISGDIDQTDTALLLNTGYSISGYFLNPTFSFIYRF